MTRKNQRRSAGRRWRQPSALDIAANTTKPMKTKKQQHTIKIETSNTEVLTEVLHHTKTKLELFAMAEALGVSKDAVKHSTAGNVAQAIVEASGKAFIAITYVR